MNNKNSNVAPVDQDSYWLQEVILSVLYVAHSLNYKSRERWKKYSIMTSPTTHLEISGKLRTLKTGSAYGRGNLLKATYKISGCLFIDHLGVRSS